VSYYGDVASGPAIILLAAAAFGVVYVATGAARGRRGRPALSGGSATNPALGSEAH
jgi:hypothetical protein